MICKLVFSVLLEKYKPILLRPWAWSHGSLGHDPQQSVLGAAHTNLFTRLIRNWAIPCPCAYGTQGQIRSTASSVHHFHVLQPNWHQPVCACRKHLHVYMFRKWRQTENFERQFSKKFFSDLILGDPSGAQFSHSSQNITKKTGLGLGLGLTEL